MRPIPLLLALSLVLSGTATGQDAADDGAAADFERALRAVERGEIRRLSSFLPGIEKQLGGRAIEVEIETGPEGRWRYELEFLTADGRLFEVDVDAVTGDIIDVEEELD